MIIEPLRDPFRRESFQFSFAEPAARADVYGFAGRGGRINLDGQLLRPASGRADTALLFMHPATSLALLPLPRALAESGVHVLCAHSRYLRNDTPLILEKVALDMGAHVQHAREVLGYRKVVLAGWSGGGSLSVFYQAQATRPHLTTTPDGEPYDLAGAELIPADGMLSIAAHLSRAETLTEWLDPSVRDESDPDQRDPALDIYAASPLESPPFDADFMARFRAAQVARNRRITTWAEQQLEHLKALKGPDQERGFIVHRTMCDPRWIDPGIDPNARRIDWCYLGDPRVANSAPAGLARYTTLRAWLSQWSLDHTRGKTADNAPVIEVPALVVENGADDATPASHPRAIFELLGSDDKTFRRIDGATHYYQEQPEHLAAAVDVCREWLGARGFI